MGPIGPVVGHPAPAVPSYHDRNEVGPSNAFATAVAEQLPPVERKRAAARTIEDLEAPDQRRQQRRERALALVNGTFDSYRDGTRVESKHVFENDSQAVKALGAFVDTEQASAVDSATELIVSADDATAARAIADAERALARTEGQVTPEGKRRAAESHLANARRAYERAQQTLEADGNGKSGLARRLDARARALQHLKTAWVQAQQALDALDAGTAPQVTILTRQDPVRNGSENTTRRIVGRVFDPRPYELSNATVTVGGDRTMTVPLNASTASAANATFDFEVTLDERTTTVEVTVEDAPAVEDDERSGENNGKKANRGRGNDAKGQPEDGGESTPEVGRDVLRLDGDGLADTYEVDVVETVPVDHDSDAATTPDADESDDGTVDGAEDYDNDTLTTRTERAYEIDPLASDTDGDNLTDAFEVRNSPVSPRNADTDDDDVLDGQADLDGDELVNRREQDAGTSPVDADTDLDGLNDTAELDAHETDSLVADTDTDGLTDGEEIRLGTDPLVADTDGDGVLDGDETFETTTTEETTGVEVTVRGQGDAAAATAVTPEPTFFPDSTAGDIAAGPTVRIENRTAFENATVRIPIDGDVPESEYENLSVYTWNGSGQDRWTALNTTVEDGTAAATVDSFSYFTVLDADEWTGAISVGADPGVGEPFPLESQPNFTCSGACAVTNTTTLLVGGEPSARKIVVEQGSETYEVVPLSNGQAIERFYDYGNAEINSPLPIAKSDTSRLFVWSGPDGLSLVVIHDEPRDGSGAAVSMDFVGLPTGEGSWVVQDDPGDFPSETGPDWSWNNDNTDGGAYRGGLTNGTVTIEPAFNADAARAPLTPGSIERWELLTGQATAPRNFTLDRDEPVTIRIPEAPAEDDSAVSGDSGRANWTYDLSRDDRLTIFYQTEQTDVDPTATLVVTDEDGTTVTESLNVGTVGTVREVVNLTALSGETATIEVRADGVNLRAEIAPGAGGVDTDGDGISDAIERQTHTAANGPGVTFTTNPFDNDTDGDGIPDGEEVSFRRAVVDGELTTTAFLRSDPTAADTDGDGLTDPEEFEGHRVATTRSKEDSRGLLSASEPSEFGQHLTEYNASSNPLVADTDGDRLDDLAERNNSTDPTRADTDGDTILDGHEVAVGADPTLFDFRGPDITVYRANFFKPAFSLDTTYRLGYSVADPSGVLRTSVLKGGTERHSASFDNPDAVGVNTQFTTGIGETALDSLTGATVKIRAQDRHQNEKTIVGFERANFYGSLAGKLGGDDIFAAPIAGDLGRLSGFAASLGAVGTNVVQLVQQLLEDPLFFLDIIDQIITLVTEISAQLVQRIVDAAIEQFERKQERNNPYEQDDALYDVYRGGWYSGYVGGFVAKTLLGASAAKAIKSTNTAQRITNGLESTRVGKVLTKVDELGETGKTKLATTIVRKVDGVPGDYIGEADTVGQVYRLWRLQQKADANLDSVDAEGQGDVAGFLARNGDDGARVLADGGDDAIAVIRRFDDVDDDTADRLADLRRTGDLDTSDLNKLENAFDSGEIDGNELRRISRILTEEGEFHYDEDVTVDDILKLADNDDLSNTVGVVAPDDTVTKGGNTVDTVQLDVGDESTGRTHLFLRHLSGKDRERVGVTTFWPVGQTVGTRTLSDVLSPDQIDDLIYRAIKNGDGTDTGTEVTYTYSDVDVDGIDRVIVKVDEQTGRVISAYPGRGGSKVDTYYGNVDEWNIEED